KPWASTLEAGACTLELACDGGDGVTERRGRLLGRPVEDIAQDQHRSLFGRQELDCRDERQLDGLSQDEVVKQAVRIGLEVVEIVSRFGWPGTRARNHREADVRRNRVQPGGELRA